MAEHVMWMSPRSLPAPTAISSAPAVISFKSDDFMAELQAALKTPSGLSGFEAEAETWRDDAPNVFPAPTPSTDSSTVTKLFQPVHGRFYLVATHLVCRRYGLPDRRTGTTETTGFVVRRLVDDNEYAWTLAGNTGSWRLVGEALTVGAGEEVLPFAPLTHEHSGRKSRLFTGLVPVGARERYETRRAVPSTPTTSDEPHVLQMMLRETVLSSLERLADEFDPAHALLGDTYLEALEFALLDLADWVAIARVGLERVSRFDQEVNAGGPTWGEVIDDIAAHRQDVLMGEYDWLSAATPTAARIGFFLADPTDIVVTLRDQLEAGVESPAPTPPEPGGLPDLGDEEGLYVFRSVYNRSDCVHPHQGWVSEPAGPYRFASFFDPDAPARPVQITLPIDTSPGGLRQFPRNFSVLVSAQLRRQMTQIDDEFNPLPGQGFSLGQLCSLSIPIITICALILLLIIASILNMIFYWLPFFKVCLPVPGGEE